MFAQDSIDMLQRSGIDFQKHAQFGIEISHFGELLISSGFVLTDVVKWIAFHGCGLALGGSAATTAGPPAHANRDPGHQRAGFRPSAVPARLSTYDFGYLLKVVTCEALPEDEALFYELLHLYFPCIYDIKYLMKSCKNLRGGLQEVADTLAVRGQTPAGANPTFAAAQALCCFGSGTACAWDRRRVGRRAHTQPASLARRCRPYVGPRYPPSAPRRRSSA